jgi:Mn2+/Fe2+ NRAMP family transporter
MKLKIGPGAMITAAFIGPGTVTTATLAGANYGYVLLWALIFATIATIILQDMAARLGVGARLGLGEALMAGSGNPILKWGAGLLVLAALAVGNAAYQSGNLSGGALGLETLLGAETVERRTYVLILGGIAGVLLLIGHYRLLERVLIGLVLVMSLAFAVSFILVRPDIGDFFSGAVPSIPDESLMTVVALIGTTIVPYNLFLHAAAARERWSEGTEESLSEARGEARLSIGIGGLVSIFILATAAASLYGAGLTISGAGDMALAIEPAFGPAARYLVATGLLAAGLTSALTAPMATAYAVTEVMGMGREGAKTMAFRAVALGILAIGIAVASLGLNTVSLILVAQLANGLLLPIVAGFLLITMNRKSLLGDHANGWIANALGGIVLVITVGLGARYILRALGVM